MVITAPWWEPLEEGVERWLQDIFRIPYSFTNRDITVNSRFCVFLYDLPIGRIFNISAKGR